MSLPAHTDAYSASELAKWQVLETRTDYVANNGSTSSSTGQVARRKNVVLRTGHSSNSTQSTAVPGVRRCSDYYRAVAEHRYLVPRERVYKVSTGTYTYTEWPNDDVRPNFYSIPGYWDGRTNATWRTDLAGWSANEAYKRLKDQKVAFGQTCAELGKSADMVAARSLPLLEALNELRRGRLPQTRKLREFGLRAKRRPGSTASGLLLEYQYGWRPLMQDIYGLYQVVQENALKTNPVIIAHGTFRDNLSGSATHSTSYTKRRWNASVRTTTVLVAKPSDDFLRRANQLGLINPLSLGWELVPYSFVVDWFCPIGNMLEGLTAAAGLSFVTGSQSMVLEGTTTVSDTRSYQQNYQYEQEYFAHYRKRLTAFPGVAPPPVRLPFSTANVMSALALWGVLKSR